jgi:hypothetical protein
LRECHYTDGWLVGSTRRIARRVGSWLDGGETGLIIRYGPQGLKQKVHEPLEVFEAIAAASTDEPKPADAPGLLT